MFLRFQNGLLHVLLQFFQRRWGVVALVLVAGCGGDAGPRQYEIQGKVLFDGQPLQSGRITFVPDPDRGNSGPPGYAIIKNGEYSTTDTAGKASVPGALKVLITGFDTAPGPGGEPKPPIFESYPASADVDPKEHHSQIDFEVPKDAAKKYRGR